MVSTGNTNNNQIPCAVLGKQCVAGVLITKGNIMITVKVDENEKDTEIEYPCLMISKINQTIILFTDYRDGTVVREGIGESVGYHSSSWVMGGFKPFKGSITLSQ